MKLTIGVMGSAGEPVPVDTRRRLVQLGQAIADHDCILITGGCPGLPQAAVEGAKTANGWVVGISPGLSLWEHVHKYGSPTDGYDVLIYTGSGLMGREVENIRSSDIVVIAGGRSGKLGEFAIAYEEGKLIGVLTGTGGVADAVKELVLHLDKPTGAVVLHDDEPERLIQRLLDNYHAEHHQHPNCFCPPAEETSATSSEAR
jgi:uncharacterized protein (TIGR00725 family)